VQLFSATQGASLAYATEAREQARWLLYTGPLRVEPGEALRLRARAVRIGYAESEERAATFTATSRGSGMS